MKETILITTVVAIQLLSNMLQAQNKISGKICDINGNALSFVNVYLQDSLEGTSTDSDGDFHFETASVGQQVLHASMVGFLEYTFSENVKDMQDLQITLQENSILLDGIQVKENRQKLSSTINHQNAINVVSNAGAQGDLLKALTFLPGSQLSGTDGRLVVRGGNSAESQTYIDDLHVLSPYGASVPNQPSRSRYSPFFFSRINLSSGGYSSEYSQSMSSILPLYTKDESKDTKFGINLMNVSLGAGGTKAWTKSSLSLNFDYGNMGMYNRLFQNDTKKWNQPIKFLSSQQQFRHSFNDNVIYKLFVTYDKTTFTKNEYPAFTDRYTMDYDENNVYTNTTLQINQLGYNFFAGTAYSYNKQKIDGANQANTMLDKKESELHMKVKMNKRLSELYRFEIGAEDFEKRFDQKYFFNEEYINTINHRIAAVYSSNDFRLVQGFDINLSLRYEYTASNKASRLLPRLALNYKLQDVVLCGIMGRYQQLPEYKYLVYNTRLANEVNSHYQLGAEYRKNNTWLRMELYYKDYKDLPMQNFTSSKGYGYSKGIDMYINSILFQHTLDCTMTYTFNDSKRNYLDYNASLQPDFATKHNLSLGLKYSNLDRLPCLFGLTTRLASGRAYTDPNLGGMLNRKTPLYFATDVSCTYLVNKKLIVYVSVSNIFDRKNVYGYDYNKLQNMNGRYDRNPITLANSQNIYIGIFWTLGENVAYDPSHF